MKPMKAKRKTETGIPKKEVKILVDGLKEIVRNSSDPTTMDIALATLKKFRRKKSNNVLK